MRISISAAITFCLTLSGAPALAQTAEEKSFLSLYFSEEELVVQSATRSPQALSRVAENMTVVTAAEIERMNAHTLADVLNTVPGVEVAMIAGPGSASSIGILGSTPAHVTVILDGVVINDLWGPRAEIGNIPVQNIEKIEIVKGPASSAWGSALGGVVNVITKTGRVVDQGGVLSGSYGNATFGDFRAEVRGKAGQVRLLPERWAGSSPGILHPASSSRTIPMPTQSCPTTSRTRRTSGFHSHTYKRKTKSPTPMKST